MAVTVLPPPGAATASKGGTTTADDLRAMLARAKGTITRTATKHKQVTMALLLTAEIQASMFGWSFASGYAAKKGKSLKLMGVDTRPVIAILLAGGALFSDDAAPHLFAVANGTLGSFMAEWAFDLGVRAATSKEEKEAAAAAKQASTPPAQPAAAGAVPDDVPPAIRLHVARESGEAEWAAGDVEVETGSGLRLTPQANINHWYRVWGREMAQYKFHKGKGHQKRADRSLANAQNAKASGLNVYQRAKSKGRNVVLPEGWKSKPKAQTTQQQRGSQQQGQRPQVRMVRPQPQQQIVYDELPYDESYEDYSDEGDAFADLEAPGQGDFFEYLETLSDDQLDAISGADEEAGEADESGDLPLDWPADEFADFMPNTAS